MTAHDNGKGCPLPGNTDFTGLVEKRISNVLLIAGSCDAFMQEDGGRVEERVSCEYAKLGLRCPPRFFWAVSREEAEREIGRTSFDLVICMPVADNHEPFYIAQDIKSGHPATPVVVLLPSGHGTYKGMDFSQFDYVFCRLGDTGQLLSVIKLVEDRMNLEHDVAAGVQMILLVEDSACSCSSVLPHLYRFVLRQDRDFSTEVPDARPESMRLRGRPRIVLARNYEEAWHLYGRYKSNLSGVIGECRFPRDGKTDERAGYELLSAIRTQDEHLPLVMVSAGHDKIGLAKKCGARFIDKDSRDIREELCCLLREYFGFGDLVFRHPDTMEEGTCIKNQEYLQDNHQDRFSNFSRMGEGSLGGKGKGLAFLDHIVKLYPELNAFDNACVKIPRTVVLCTGIFDEFMDSNKLYPAALSDIPDEDILSCFLQARLPDRLLEELATYLDVVRQPVAIRSSSLLEDTYKQPFAGIYSTYMIPYVESREERLEMLCNAIKGVYASVFYRDSKAYMAATQNVIEQEKMAVILQEVVGNRYGDRFYPNISGVARSVNYYPIGDEKAEEGIAHLALGLGKYIVDGGMNLRVCPAHPDKVLQTSDMEIALRETQTRFYALDMNAVKGSFRVDDGFNLLKVPVREAEADGSLQYIASTYDPYDMVIRDGIYEGGRKLITFCGVLQQGVFPLPELLRLMLKYGQDSMRKAVEIEFAVNLDNDRTGVFYLLQIRPMVDNKMVLDEELAEIPDDRTLIRSHNAIGHGVTTDIYDVVYVKTEDYSAYNNPVIADEIDRINRCFLEEGRNYVLVGPGRWGSSDPWLGVPVKWPNISAARVIVESGLTNYRVDPSQGTHFFQNLTSFGVGYFTVNDFLGDGVYNQAFLNAQPAQAETPHVRHVRFFSPVVVKVDGMKKEGVVMMPEG